MSAYAVRGFGGGIGTGANGMTWASLWNPHSTRRIKITRISWFVADFSGTVGQSVYLSRISTRGTPTSTITPDADNGDDQGGVPPSGTVLDLGDFTVQPTVASPELLPALAWGAFLTGSQGTGFMVPLPRGIVVPPGSGVAIIQRLDEQFTGGDEVSFEFED